MEILIGAILGAIFSLIVSLIFIPIYQDRVTDFFVNNFSECLGLRLRKSDSLSGEWRQNWQVDGYQMLTHKNPKLTLNQLGKSIVGTFYFEDRVYKIRARIENSTYISGTWFDEKSGQVYHGTFQARIEVNQREINGKWIGFSSKHNKINTGSWQWIRNIK
jgi:hypothetical protein